MVIKINQQLVTGGTRSAASSRRKRSRAESSGDKSVRCLSLALSFLFPEADFLSLVNRGRTTTSRRLPMQATHMPWLSSAK